MGSIFAYGWKFPYYNFFLMQKKAFQSSWIADAQKTITLKNFYCEFL